jgi:hypothetical protein
MAEPQTLEQLMAEFQSTAVTAPSPPPLLAQPAPLSGQQQVHQAALERARSDAAVAEDAHQRNTRALEQAVREFKRAPDMSAESDVMVEGYLLARARRDDAFNADVSSGDARRAEKALAQARRDYQNELRGDYIQSDTLRARASVRAGADQPEAPPEFDPIKVSRMSDSEYASYMAKRTGAVQARPPNVWTGDSRSVAASPWAAHDRSGAGGGPQAQGQSSSRSRPMIGRGR